MTTDLYKHIGHRIRELRTAYGGEGGISQNALAKALNVSGNTVSRWENSFYHPTVEDLQKLAGFFGATILDFVPHEDVPKERNENIAALMRAAKLLDDNELAELRQYAEWRRSRRVYRRVPPGRKATG